MCLCGSVIVWRGRPRPRFLTLSTAHVATGDSPVPFEASAVTWKSRPSGPRNSPNELGFSPRAALLHLGFLSVEQFPIVATLHPDFAVSGFGIDRLSGIGAAVVGKVVDQRAIGADQLHFEIMEVVLINLELVYL